jgi:fructose-6-phosphate aldolase 2
MLYLLDTANVQEIKKAVDLYPIHGVTTNPTIISKEKRDFFSILRDIRQVIGKESMLHVQVLGENADDIIREAYCLRENIEGNLYVKIPVIPQGIKAIKKLKAEGFNITATAVITSNQALMAAVAGADFVAPYVNRIDNICGNGVQVVSEMLQEFKLYNLTTKVLAASFKNVQQICDVSKLGVHSMTLPAELMDKAIEHPLTDWSIKQFKLDWSAAYENDLIEN